MQLASLAVAGVAIGADSAQAQGGIVFPSVSGSSLAKQEFNLPEDFEGRCNLVLIAFKREQQALVDTWLEPARELAAVNPDFRYYELPTIYAANRLVRWWIDNGMRSGIKDQAARATTITLYLDKDEFLSSLDIPNENNIYILLVDDEGQVRWRSDGAYTDEKGASMRSVLDRLRAQ